MSILKKSVITLWIAASLVSCDSNNNNNDIDLPGFLGTLTARIDGTSWNAATATASRFTNLSIPTIIITGVDLGGAGISLGFADVDGVGTFDFSSTNVTAMSWTPNTSSGSYTAETGTATITSFTADNIKGTFSFEGMRFNDGATVSVTNGVFDVGNFLLGN